MVDVLAKQMEGMEETWDSILDNVRTCSINTNQNTLFGEFSILVVSTRRIVDVALKWLCQFYVELLVNNGPGQEVAVDEVTSVTLDDVMGENNINDDNDVVDENAGNDADDDENQHDDD